MPSATETYSIRAGVNSAGDDATRGRLVTAAAPSSEAEPDTGAAAPQPPPQQRGCRARGPAFRCS